MGFYRIANNQPPNVSGLEQQWFTSCSRYVSKEGQEEDSACGSPPRDPDWYDLDTQRVY